MIEQLSYWGFLTVGFLVGVGHCVGMCGPFVIFVSTKFVPEKQGGAAILVPHLFYNLGRTITYTGLGVVAGLIGGAVELGGRLMGFQKGAALVAGAFLIAYGLLSLFGGKLLQRIEEKATAHNFTASLLRRFPKHPLVVGLALGFLPCGPLYGALLGATALGTWTKGALAMALFGVGTMPALLVLAFFSGVLVRRRAIFQTFAMVILIVMGGWFLYQGIVFAG